MRNFLILVVFMVAAGAAVPKAHTDPVPELSQYLEDQIDTADKALTSSQQVQTSAPQEQEGWFFRRIWIRLRFMGGINVPPLTVKVIPETELLFERPLPNGWKLYSP